MKRILKVTFVIEEDGMTPYEIDKNIIIIGPNYKDEELINELLFSIKDVQGKKQIKRIVDISA